MTYCPIPSISNLRNYSSTFDFENIPILQPLKMLFLHSKDYFTKYVADA